MEENQQPMNQGRPPFEPVPQPPVAQTGAPMPPAYAQQPIYAPQPAALNLEAQPVEQPFVVQKRNRPTGLLIGVILGAIGILVTIALIISSMFVPQADYKHAQTSLTAINKAYLSTLEATKEWMNTVTNRAISDEQVAHNQTQLEQVYGDYKKRMTDFNSEKALKDTSVKKAYDELVAKNRQMQGFYDDMIATMPLARSVVLKCNPSASSGAFNDFSRLVAQYDTIMNPCASSLKELATGKMPALAKTAQSASDQLESARGEIVKIQAAHIANDKAAFDTALATFQKKAKKLTIDVSKDGLSDEDMKKMFPNDELQAFTDLLSSKVQS